MKIIVPVNNKGGVGKTHTAELISQYSSLILKKSTLKIDFDAQCNLSQNSLKMEIDPAFPEGYIPPIHPDYDPTDPDDMDWDGRSSIADIFFNLPVIPYPTKIENLDIAPAHAEKLLRAEAVTRSEVVDKIHNRLRQFLNCKDVQDTYEVVVIDTAPSKGPLTVSAVRAATHLIIPSIMEDKATRGVFGMFQLFMQEQSRRSLEHPIELVGILPTKFDGRTSLHNQLYDSLRSHPHIGKYLLPSDAKISQRILYAEIDADPNINSIFDLPDSNIARREILHVCECIAERVFN